MEPVFEKILVPLDGSEESEGILPFVQAMAGGLGASVLLITVVHPGALDLRERPGDLYGRWEQYLRNRLPELVSDLEANDVSAESAVVYGKPPDEILKTAVDSQFDLVALATNARGLLGWVALGSVTYSVIHASLIPTLTISLPKARQYWERGGKISRVVVPLDGSEMAESALPYAEYLARRLELSLLVVRAIPTRAGFPSLLSDYAADHVRREEEKATEYLEEVTGRLRARGLRADWRVLRGPLAPGVVELTHEEIRDMVVMATEPRDIMAQRVIASDTVSIIQNSASPVLVIPPGGSYQRGGR